MVGHGEKEGQGGGGTPGRGVLTSHRKNETGEPARGRGRNKGG